MLLHSIFHITLSKIHFVPSYKQSHMAWYWYLYSYLMLLMIRNVNQNYIGIDFSIPSQNGLSKIYTQ